MYSVCIGQHQMAFELTGFLGIHTHTHFYIHTCTCCLLRKGSISCHMTLSFPLSSTRRSLRCVQCETCSESQWRHPPGILSIVSSKMWLRDVVDAAVAFLAGLHSSVYLSLHAQTVTWRWVRAKAAQYIADLLLSQYLQKNLLVWQYFSQIYTPIKNPGVMWLNTWALVWLWFM